MKTLRRISFAVAALAAALIGFSSCEKAETKTIEGTWLNTGLAARVTQNDNDSVLAEEKLELSAVDFVEGQTRMTISMAEKGEYKAMIEAYTNKDKDFVSMEAPIYFRIENGRLIDTTPGVNQPEEGQFIEVKLDEKDLMHWVFVTVHPEMTEKLDMIYTRIAPEAE